MLVEQALAICNIDGYLWHVSQLVPIYVNKCLLNSLGEVLGEVVCAGHTAFSTNHLVDLVHGWS